MASEIYCDAYERWLRMLCWLRRFRRPKEIQEAQHPMKRFFVLVLDPEQVVADEILGTRDGKHEAEPTPEHPISLKRLMQEAVRQLERKLILQTLQDNDWNRKKAARALKLSYRSMFYKMKAFEMATGRIFPGTVRSQTMPGEPRRMENHGNNLVQD